MAKQDKTTAARKRTAKGDTDNMLDPDTRFLLANERTLLAWIRTSLAVIAGGILLTQLGQRTSMQIGFGIAAILFGAVMAIVGYIRFQAADRAIRSAKLPDTGRGPAVQVIGVVGFAVILVIIESIRLAD